MLLVEMPERVKKLEGQVQVLHVDLEELTGTLRKFLEPEGSGQPVPESRRSLHDYVS
jgi:GTP cyclohydrolase III